MNERQVRPLRGEPGSFVTGRNFLLYGVSQFVAGLGDSFQTVASAVLLYELTGSGLFAGIGAVIPLLAGLALSPFAGLLGDRYPPNRLLAAIGAVKGLAVMLFAFATTLWQCCLLILIFSAINVFYGIPGRKITACLVPQKNLLAGNSLLNGLSGAAFFVGPVAAGIVARVWGAGEALAAGGALYLASSLTVLFLQLPEGASAEAGGSPLGRIREGFAYALGNADIRQAMLIYCGVAFGSASTNLAFYPYAFDILRTDSAQWGIFVSVFNGVVLLSTVLSVSARGRMASSFRFLAFLPCLGVAAAWAAYSLIDRIAFVLPALALEGTSYFFVVTLLTTRLQLSCDLGRMARVLAANDIFVNSARLLGIGCALVILCGAGARAVFTVNAVLLSGFAAVGLTYAAMRKPRERAGQIT